MSEQAETIHVQGVTTVHDDTVTSAPANPDTPTPTKVAPEGDPSLTRQEQASHPFSDPVPAPEAAPKVDAGDVGAEVGVKPDNDAIRDHVGKTLNVDAGYLGYNPDPRSNDEYTVAGVLGAAGGEA